MEAGNIGRLTRLETISNSIEQTIQLGKVLGKALRGGEVIALNGELASGKTHLVKGLAQGLDVPDTQQVVSPTFTLVNEYQGRMVLYHIDAYRLESSRQLELLGFDEMCMASGVVAVEWADKVKTLIASYNPIYITLKHTGQGQRSLKINNLPKYIAQEKLYLTIP